MSSDDFRDSRAARIWHLVHDIRMPMRRAAALIEVPVSEAYELLAFWKLRRDALEARVMSRLNGNHKPKRCMQREIDALQGPE
jgi:hypothetical protein